MKNLTHNELAVLVAQGSEAQSRLETMVGIPGIDAATFAGDFERAKSVARDAHAFVNAMAANAPDQEAQHGFAFLGLAVDAALVRMRFEKFKADHKIGHPQSKR